MHRISEFSGKASAEPDRVVGSFRSYSGAAAAVDKLAEQRFPVERATVVARGLRFVQDVVGRRRSAHAAAEGALKGAAVGGFVGVVFGLFTVAEAGLALGLLAWGVATGAIVGIAIGVFDHAVRGRRFESISSLEAERYDVVVDAAVAPEAERILTASASRHNGIRRDGDGEAR